MPGKDRIERGEQFNDFVAEAAPDPTNLAYKQWQFGPIQRGDCLIENGGTFTLYSDGSTSWVCDISSGDSGDEWDGYFRILSATGAVLFDTGRYHFDISEKDVKKRWNESRGPHAGFAMNFDAASGISFECSC